MSCVSGIGDKQKVFSRKVGGAARSLHRLRPNVAAPWPIGTLTRAAPSLHRGAQECVRLLGLLATERCPVAREAVAQPHAGKIIAAVRSRFKVR